MTPECYGCLSVAYRNLKKIDPWQRRSGRRNQRRLEKAQKLVSKAKRMGTQVEFPKILDQWGRLDLKGFELIIEASKNKN